MCNLLFSSGIKLILKIEINSVKTLSFCRSIPAQAAGHLRRIYEHTCKHGSKHQRQDHLLGGVYMIPGGVSFQYDITLVPHRVHLYSLTWYKLKIQSGTSRSFQNEFIPVVEPDRNFVPDRNLGNHSTSIMLIRRVGRGVRKVRTHPPPQEPKRSAW